MKTVKLLIISIVFTGYLSAQQNDLIPDLSKVKDLTIWNLSDREIIDINPIHLSKGEGDGILWNKEIEFANGTIEFDIQGKDIRGQSFVGVAFHGVDENNFELVYFRPFNFKSKEKQGNSIQYVSLPEYTWQKLRKEHPGVYENAPVPVPDPNSWFHAKIVVEYPVVKVFIDNAEEPSLVIEQLNTRKTGWIGLWVGSNSEGLFKNLKISKK